MQINCDDPEAFEVIESYGLKVPVIKVFRRGILSEYRGPTSNPEEIRDYLLKDSLPSIHFVTKLDELKRALSSQVNAIILGLFANSGIIQDETEETFSMTPWGQFQQTADSLRGHAVFFASTASDIIEGFQASESDLPIIFMLSDDGEGLLQYTGELLEMNLSEWILRNNSPAMGELSLATSTGELFTTQFFSSRKFKFILLLRSSDIASLALDAMSLSLEEYSTDEDEKGVFSTWRELSLYFKSRAIFAYMVDDGVADVLDFFALRYQTDLPRLVAHDPSTDAKYTSPLLTSLTPQTLKDFVAGVLSGYIKKVIKSEPGSPSSHPSPEVY